MERFMERPRSRENLEENFSENIISPIFYRDILNQSEIKNIYSKNFLENNLLKQEFSKIKNYESWDLEELSNSSLEFLESEIVFRRSDSFIRQAIRYIPEEREHSFRPIRTEYPARSGFSSTTGLSVSIMHGDPLVTVDGSQVGSNRGRYARVDFTPGGRMGFATKVIDGRKAPDFRKMTDSLVMGINGVVELIEAIDRGEIEVPDVLVGHTNINMALIAQRLGFAIVDQSRTSDGKIDGTQSTFTVAGRLEDVRAKVEEFKESGRVERLQQRADRATVSARK